MGVFANKTSCNRMLYGLFERLQRNWSRRPLIESTQDTSTERVCVDKAPVGLLEFILPALEESP